MPNYRDGKTILLVEDEALIALSEAGLLQRNGFSVITAGDAVQAIEKVRAHPVDLILMDIDLGQGKMDGTQAAEIILRDHDLPIVFLTSHSEKEMVDRVKGITRYGYVVKFAGDFVLIESINMAFELFESHKKLKESEENAQKLLQAIPDLVFRFSREGNILDYKAGKNVLYQSDPDMLIGHNIAEVLPGDFVADAMIRIEKTLHSGELDRYEYRLPIPGSGMRDFEARMVRIGPEEVVSIIRDITAKKNAEKIILESETRVRNAVLNSRSLFKSSPDGIIELNKDGEIIDANPAYCRMSGYSREELLTMRISELKAWKDYLEPELFLSKLRESGTTVYETEHKRKDGSMFPVEVSVSFLPDEQCVIGFIRNISLRRRREEDLKEEREKLLSIICGTHVGTWEWNAQTGESRFNELWAEMLGYTLEELSPVSIETWRRLTHPGDLNKAEDALRMHFTGKSDRYECEIRMKHKQDGWVWVLDRGKVVSRTESGEPLWMYGTHQDISQFKKLIEEKDVLMQELNHRIKNNLIMISSLIWLKNSSLGGAADLSDLAHQVDAVALVHEKLHQSPDISLINLRGYIPQLLETVFSFSGRPVLIEGTIEEIELSTRKAVPLGLIINEIATNAVKHGFRSPDKAVFSLNACRNHQTGQISITVSNNGDPFPGDVDLENSTTLGLRLISILMRQLHGTINMAREPHPVFFISLPREG